ncbi:MAG: DoxX family membrane protein [Methylophilaceae bacterium]|tara:strand:- start:772 stop:1173 length:402 start_codon:yes stop_codon:yes gene_type:complete
MQNFYDPIARVLLSLIFFISVLFILSNILSTPNGYGNYQDMLGARGLPGIFAPLSILIQLVAGFTLIIGYKIKITAYVLAAYSFIWSIVYLLNAFSGQPHLLLMALQYLTITGGLFYMGVRPATGYSIDGLKK